MFEENERREKKEKFVLVEHFKNSVFCKRIFDTQVGAVSYAIENIRERLNNPSYDPEINYLELGLGVRFDFDLYGKKINVSILKTEGLEKVGIMNKFVLIEKKKDVMECAGVFPTQAEALAHAFQNMSDQIDGAEKTKAECTRICKIPHIDGVRFDYAIEGYGRVSAYIFEAPEYE